MANLTYNLGSECTCLYNGAITSPGYPGNYGHNFNKTWLIQLPLGQNIQVGVS